MMDKKTIAAMIDHTLLKPEATPARIEAVRRSGGVSLCQCVCQSGLYSAGRPPAERDRCKGLLCSGVPFGRHCP